jgi:RNA recognition motif-containing protein
MTKRIYVGNLPFTASEDEVRELFEAFGTVTSVSLITDRETGRPRGFGFVEMEDGADEAISSLDGNDMGGRPLKINEARPREGGGGGGGGVRGGGGGGGGRRW